MLVLTQYELKKYELFVEWLEVSTEIVIQLQLKIIPYFTTLPKTSSMLSDILLNVTIGRFIGMISLGKYLQDLMPHDLRTIIELHTLHIVVISGTLTPRCQ
jgi:hypothetical protein